jgi:hypothetical protein
MTSSSHGTGWSDLDAARLLLGKLGVRPADLVAAPASADFPLIADYIPLVEKAVTTGTRRVYGPYWARVVREWGHRRVNEPTALEISQLAEQVRAGAVQRRNARGGRGAAEHLIGALRCMYRYLVADGILTQAENRRRGQKSRAGSAAPAWHCPIAASMSCAGSRPRPATTRPWTRSCCGCTWKRHAAAAEPWRWRLTTWTPNSA